MRSVAGVPVAAASALSAAAASAVASTAVRASSSLASVAASAASNSSASFEASSAGAAARLAYVTSRRGLHTSPAAAQKTAAKAGAAPKKGAGAAAAVTVFLRAGEAPAGPTPALPVTAPERPWDFTKPLLPKHQALFKPALVAAAAPKEAPKWTPASRRVGVLALKCGMTADWDAWGVRHALTVVALEDVVVTGVATEAGRSYTALQVGCAPAKPKHVTKPLQGYFAAQGVEPRAHLAEFRVTPDALLPVGTRLWAQHFLPGQAVNVQGVTQGKGFQGAMKRWGFAGQGASHGNSVSHRVLGSTGCRHDPGRVAKGKKMPGHMGVDTRTVECLTVWKVDVARQLLYLKGAVPGKAGSLLRLYDAPKRPFAVTHPGAAPPFPAYTPSEADAQLLADWKAGAFATPEEELLLDAVAVGLLPVGTGGAASTSGAAASSAAASASAGGKAPSGPPSSAPDVSALVAAARVAGVPLEGVDVDNRSARRDPTGAPAGLAISPAVYARLSAKKRAPPVELVMQPPSVDPFGIPENDEGEDA